MTPHPDKTALRMRLRGLRRRLAHETPHAAERAAAHLPLERLPPFHAFSLYQPMGSELDPRPLLARLAHRGARAALPATRARDAAMSFRLWEPQMRLEPDALGIPAPPPFAPELEPDLVVAPLLGFDRSGRRLGQGAGYYDRALAGLRARKRVFVLGLAFAGQEIAELPHEDHDERLDAILTETGYFEVAQGVGG
ncbi:5-formyltetrahydrofolate cyclo-ligase [Phenylobacterium sp. LjRoot219]|uniref:5-formyltetrahydrofolate cyclo-ligase n=1 Tax=Phenylobacterium sp. LjRoot219 TaxID=3342283 RepID=UPI003ED14ECA